MRWWRVAILVLLGALSLSYFFYPEPWYRLAMGAERMRAGLDSRYIEVDGKRWHYLVGGQGPALVLLHGFAADADHFTRVSGGLTAHFTVIAPDLPGFGLTEADPNWDFTIPAQAQRVSAFLRALDIGRAHLGGSSMGGYIAGAVAGQEPDRVQSLWLLAPGGVESQHSSEFYRAVAAGTNPLNPRRAEDFEATFDYVFAERPFVPRPVRAHLGNRLSSRYPLNTRIFGAIAIDSPPLQALLGNYPGPSLIMWGAQDRVLPAQAAPALARALEEAEVLVYPDLGHLPMLEAPQRVADDYLEWFKALN